jgi:ATP-binding cassette, subfamily F, member 3
VLADVCWSSPHVLILDEPTNHLDLEACEALLEALRSYPGSIVLVSHDRFFLESLAEEFYEVSEGTVSRLSVPLAAYVASLASRLPRA